VGNLALGYTRTPKVSTPLPSEEEQRQAIVSYCREHGLRLLDAVRGGILSDTCEGNSPLAQRHAARYLAGYLCQTQTPLTLVVSEPAVLFRNPLEALEWIAEWIDQRHQVAFVSEEGILAVDSEGLAKLERAARWHELVAQERSDARGRVRQRLARLPPYGYSLDDDGYPAANDLELAALGKMLTLREKREGLDSIATILEAEGAPNRGRPWGERRVNYFLKRLDLDDDYAADAVDAFKRGQAF